jgi:hypothetical protein
MSEIGFLLPSAASVKRGSKVIHAAPMVDVPFPDGGTFRAPHSVAYCGVRGWGDAGSGPVTCKRCLRAIGERLWNEAVDWLLNSRHTADPDIQTAFWGMVEGRFTREQADNGCFEYDAEGNARPSVEGGAAS